MQKRVRKNSDYICPKKPKLDANAAADTEKSDAVPQYVQSSPSSSSKETDTKSESFVQSISSSADCPSDFSEVNITENSPSMLKTFGKSSDNGDTAQLKEALQKIVKTDEMVDDLDQVPNEIISGDSPNKNVYSGNVHLQENSEDPVLNKAHDNESMESLSSFKLMQRENDILIDFDTNTSIEGGASNHALVEGNSICIPNENELFLTDTSSVKDVPKPLNPKLNDEVNVTKANPLPPASLLSGSSAPPPLEVTPTTAEVKKLPTNGDQSTAKVSIGNTTISVPLLKPVNFRRIITNEGKSVSNIVRKVINIRGKKIKAPTIVQLSQVHLNPKTNAKIVQATLVGNKIQLPNIGFKSSSGYIKSNFVQTSQCSPMAVTSLPKQIFEDEMVFVDKPPEPQAQNQSTENYELKAIDANNKQSAKPKEELVPKSSPSYMAQYCVIETDSTAPAKTFDSSTVTDSITVSTSGETLSKVTTTTMSKTSRKPLMLTKTVAQTSEVVTGTTLMDAIRTQNAASGDASQPKDNNQQQQMVDNKMIGKMLEDNMLLRKQIALAVQNSNRFQLKVTKSSEENKGLKRNEMTVCPTKRQPLTNNKSNPIITQQNSNTTNSETVLIANRDNVEKIQPVKSDETQNVLLKHLLQSSINQRSNTACNQSMAPRKLATLRAPSLGVVSSLEAQLARPVIPPVSSVNDIKPELKLANKIANEKLKRTQEVAQNSTKTNRPEMISRETSFVSTFPAKPKSNTPNISPSQYEQQQMPHTTEADATKSPAVSLQTGTQSTYNEINMFKFFKQKELTKPPTVCRPTETNSNQVPPPVKMRSPDPVDIKMPLIKNEYDNLTLDGNSSTVKTKLVKMDIEQNIELRKRFKRDYQKHKRQMLINKEPQNHQKKKSRKLSKASEDFDEFIENKVVQMKQMFVLEVLEPLLSTFLGICSIYGYNDRVRNHHVEYAYHNVFKEDFGKTNLKNLVDFYSVKPYGPERNSKVNNLPSFQNKFYDEEFSAMNNNESCDKLFQFINTLKQQNLQTSENFSLISSSVGGDESRNQSLLRTNYPGIKFQRNFNSNTDRMSPIIPFVNPNHFGVVKRKKAARNKCSYGNNSVETTVLLRLSPFVAENILDILRDLENLLHVYSPVSFKLVNNNEKLNVRNIKGLYISRIRNLQKTESTNIQNFLNGTYKCCRNCHLTIICGIVGADSNSNIKKRILADSHFCDKFCCIQYKKKGRKYVVQRKRERFYPNNKAINRISTNENNCCNNSNYKVVSPNCFWKPSYKGVPNEDVNDICLKMRIAITLNTNKDTRRCILCNEKGDSYAEGPSRLLNYDVNKWVHLNCALWSNSVYETINGGLMNLELTMQQGLHQICSFCNKYGASIKCFKMRCQHIYHLHCAIQEQCVFYKNKTMHCASHAHRMEKKNELSSIRVRRRVYIERDENRQVAAVMHHLELSNLLRIGNLTFINVGQLLPHQLEAFHTPNYIYPIGYKIIRFYWSMKKLNKRCRYICSIAETNGRPEFVIQVQEPFESDVELRDISPKAVWQRVLDKIAMLRKGQSLVQLFTEFMTGEDLFGLSEPSIVRILESLPGVESLTDYRFKYGRNPLLELPLALNPSGSARTEPKQRHIINWKKAHTQRTSSINLKLTLSPSSLVAGEVACPYSKQFVHSKSSQYRKMKQEWRNNVYLARSKIQGLGLYAARDLEKHTMVIEYIGQVIRTEVSELREKQYDLRNRGIYMFRLDEERVVDATLSGGLARYINHSCNPNCVTEIVDVDREYRIIIFAKRRINKGEELSYDYKFDIEDDAHKISCMCDAPNCRKWMN